MSTENDAKQTDQALDATDAVTPAAPQAVTPTPGAQLRQARESKGLTVAQIAKETMLTARYLTALEADDYEALPGSTFVRGYLRRYAPLVGLSANTLVAEFDGIWQARNLAAAPLIDAQVHALQQERVASRRGNRRASMFARTAYHLSLTRLLSLGSALLLIVLLVASFFWNDAADPVTPSESTSAAELNLDASSIEPTAEAPIDALPAESVEPLPNATDAESGAATNSNDASAEGNSSAANTAVGSEANAQGAAITPPVAEPSATSAANVPVVQSTPEPAEAAEPTPPSIDTLSFTFTGKSWISVRDATGQELVYGLKNAGQSVTVSGQPPFAINIGSVRDTQMSRNGTPVNLKPYTRGEIASFRLGR